MDNEFRKIVVQELKDAYLRNSKAPAYHKPDYEVLESFRRLMLIYMTPKEYKNWADKYLVERV